MNVQNVLNNLVSTDEKWSLFIIRVFAGGVMLPHGLQKLFGWFDGMGFSGTMEKFNEWFGLPEFMIFMLIMTETLGAICLILGLFTRLWAFGEIIVMLMAMILVTGRWGFFMNWYSHPQRGEGFEFHLLMIGMCIAVLIDGGGKWSIDHKIHKKTHKL